MSLRADPRAPGLHVGDDVSIGAEVLFGAGVTIHDGTTSGLRGTRRRCAARLQASFSVPR
jgi:acetyltransferase-like isoleucine patch superfamily enzyme